MTPAGRHRRRRRRPVRREVRRRGPRADPRPRADRRRGPYSVELCGGTHVARTGDIALFKIIAETGIAAGVRRIEALTGEAARQYLLAQAGVAKALAQSFKVQPPDVPARVEALSAERKRARETARRPEEAAGPGRRRRFGCRARGDQRRQADRPRPRRRRRQGPARRGRGLPQTGRLGRRRPGRPVRRQGGGHRRRDRPTSPTASTPPTWPGPPSSPWAARAPAASPTSPRAARPTGRRPRTGLAAVRAALAG